MSGLFYNQKPTAVSWSEWFVLPVRIDCKQVSMGPFLGKKRWTVVVGSLPDFRLAETSTAIFSLASHRRDQLSSAGTHRQAGREFPMKQIQHPSADSEMTMLAMNVLMVVLMGLS